MVIKLYNIGYGNRVKKSYFVFFLVLITGLAVSSCGYYSFKGALPSYVKAVAVPLFDDRTAYPGVREKMTNRLIEAFTTDNTLKVVDETQADLIISGAITSINQKAATVAAGETVTDYQIYVNVKVKCEDIKQSKVMYDKTVSHYGLMESSGGQDERDQAIDDAIQQITEDILNLTLASW